MLKELKIKLLWLIRKSFLWIKIYCSCINNYIIFESLDQVKENNNNKYIHVISLVNNNYIIIDKDIDVDIKINDVSVSRSNNKLNFDFEKIIII